jgi:hypothetical protein
MPGFVYRSDMHRIQATIAGVALPTSFVWDSFTGSDITQDNAYYHSGNMSPAVPTGGLPTPTDATLTVAWRSDVYPFYVSIYNAVLNDSPAASIAITPLNTDHSATVKPITYTGIALSVAKPEFQAAASSIGYMTITIAPAAGVAQN